VKTVNLDEPDGHYARSGMPGPQVWTRKLRLWLTPFLCFTTVGVANAQNRHGRESVERLKADVYYLASGTLEGRGISTPGVELAARHVRSEFRRIGLRSGTPGGSYFQSFEYRRDARAAQATLHNVIGVLDGKGALANETLVIGAHYDHLGYGQLDPADTEGPRGPIYPGADDNASGTAAMLELARRFCSRATPPCRRMVFIAFSAEEVGLAGSRHYVSKAPVFPIRDTVAMVNFDMVGRLRGNRLGVAGNESARGFNELLVKADADSPLELSLGGAHYPDDSDHAPFAAAGVPVLYVCTGSHADRHTPADTADKVDYGGVAKVVDLCEDVLDRLQVLPRPKFIPPGG
jgi:hypothetical protein